MVEHISLTNVKQLEPIFWLLVQNKKKIYLHGEQSQSIRSLVSATRPQKYVPVGFLARSFPN